MSGIPSRNPEIQEIEGNPIGNLEIHHGTLEKIDPSHRVDLGRGVCVFITIEQDMTIF
jgi:hypothetical protein